VSSETDLAPHLSEAGFEVIEIGPDENRDLGHGVFARIIPTHGGDTLMAVSDGSETCLNLNDAVHSVPAAVADVIIPRLRELYPTIDYVFCGYGIASHFPNCFVVPGKDRVQSAIRRQKYFNRRWADIIERLEPRFGFPFAADVVFLEDELAWANEPVHNGERPTDVFASGHQGSATRVFDIGPGFRIADGIVTADVRFEKVSNEQVFAVYRDERAKKLAAGDGKESDVGMLVDRLNDNVETARDYLREFPSDYRFLIVLRGQQEAIDLTKSGNSIAARKVALRDARRRDYDIIATTTYSYLRRAFTTEYGHETLFVGSGIIFEYREAARIQENLHLELAGLMRQIASPPRSRFGDQTRLLFELKKFIKKKVLGRRDSDLYDLQTWTVYSVPQRG
jgi:hypothetical protein